MDNNDILLISNRIKQSIKKIENGDIRVSVIDSLCVDFKEFIELIKLFLISERDTYYGYFLMNLTVNPDVRSESIAGVKLNSFPPVLVTNPLLLGKFSIKEIIYIICHEIDHIVFNHPTEMIKANPSGDSRMFYEFNLAADAAVNDRLNLEIDVEKHGFMSPPQGLITSDYLAQQYNIPHLRRCENYAYYYDYIKSSKMSLDIPGGIGQEQILDKVVNNSDKENPLNSDDNNDNDINEDIITANNYNGNIKDHNWNAGDDVEDVNAAVRELMNNVNDMMNEETRGLMPGYFLNQVEIINAPPVISWQSLLKKYIGTISAKKRRTRTRLNRRQPLRFDLSGTMDDKILKIVIAIDTSCSISDDMISRIFVEIFDILAKRKYEVVVIECDSEIQRVYKMKKPSDFEGKVYGRGGTSFIPVIEHINDNRYFRDALLIYFTDGYGDLSIPKPKTYRNIWVVFNNKDNLSLEEPYGMVVTM